MKNNQFIKYIFLFILLLCYIAYDIFISVYFNLKVCLCTPLKKENLYIKEFVDHYKAYNIDKIYLYDNNDIDGEHLESVLNDYIQSGYVKVVNFRGKLKALYDMMNDCYKKNYLRYDWLIFYEVDEYIHLKYYHDIKKFLVQKKFNNCETIQLNWLMHTDNDKIYYENKPLKIRFIESAKFVKVTAIKSILKGKIPNIVINCVHRINEKLKSCDGFGNKTHLEGAGTTFLDYEYNYIDHFFCKSTEEFVNKINKGDVLYMKDNLRDRIKVYFAINKPTKEKKDYMKHNIKSNISLEDILSY